MARPPPLRWKLDRPSGQHYQVHPDRADLVFDAKGFSDRFWATHPDVARFSVGLTGRADIFLAQTPFAPILRAPMKRVRLWLKTPLPALERRKELLPTHLQDPTTMFSEAPDRPMVAIACGAGYPHRVFWNRHPAIEHAEPSFYGFDAPSLDQMLWETPVWLKDGYEDLTEALPPAGAEQTAPDASAPAAATPA
jgi:hypothetical protein